MSVEKYKFISPGIFVSEIDNTGRNAIPDDVGPAIIGRAERGPILQPIKVDSFFDFVNIFGEPIPGGKGGDTARNGNYTSPTYGGYAAQAWFRNNSPVTFVRIGGQASEEADAGGEAGWKTTDTTPHSGASSNGGAFGLFISNAPPVEELRVDFSAVGQVGDVFTFNIAGGGNQTITGHATDTTTALFKIGTSAQESATNLAAAINLNTNFPYNVEVNAVGTGVVLTTTDKPTLLSGTFKCNSAAAEPMGLTRGTNTAVADGAFQGFVYTFGALTGTLAATWYIDQNASIGLSGSRSAGVGSTRAAGTYIDSVAGGAKNEFKVQVSNSSGVITDTSFNFIETDPKFIRKVFNTNPILTNSAVTKTSSNSFSRYWLGESYEGAVSKISGGDSTRQIGVILPLLSGTTYGGDFNRDYEDAKTGYFFSQDLNVGDTATGSYSATAQTDLFRLVARNSGDYASRNLKVSISNLRAAPDGTVDQPYGSFSVIIRKLSDTDNRINIVEQFNNCNLNPNSPDYIGKKIGDKHLIWDATEKRYREYGDYPNLSKYIYVDVQDEVKLGETDPRFLPFGVRGPIQFKSFTDTTSSGGRQTLVSGNFNNFGEAKCTTFISGAAATNGNILYNFPQLRLRISASEGSPVDQLNSFFGVDTTFDTSRLDKSVRDHLKVFPRGIDNFAANASLNEISFNFTLDDICFKSGTGDSKFYVYKAGSRAAVKGTYDSLREGLTYLRGTGSYTEVLDAGIDKFTTVFAGGFDGLDITEAEPLRAVNYPDAGAAAPSRRNSAVFNSIDVAIDTLRDPEVVEYNLASMPGVVNSTLNTKLVDMCESRGDALAIVDIKGGFTPPEQSTLSSTERKGSVEGVIQTLKTNVINSSYGAAYYPYVQIRDLNNGQTVTVPPSVPAIGALSYSQKISELWFAPAGFTRGGLSAGRAGLPVVGVKDRLTSRDRDKLYESRINPIAQFPAEGIVIFGQKTLQVQGSALDRINVRRLLIFLKREISRFAATILFDQNVRITWSRFRGQVEPFLRGVQAGLGITDFRLVLDDTTTTPDLVDRNILYAKIFIKPARAIEFIAVDFILTDSGAAFED